jgi:hypothetical protein
MRRPVPRSTYQGRSADPRRLGPGPAHCQPAARPPRQRASPDRPCRPPRPLLRPLRLRRHRQLLMLHRNPARRRHRRHRLNAEADRRWRGSAPGDSRMDDRTAIASPEPRPGDSHSCTKRFLVSELQMGKEDKLGHLVEDILWVGIDYAIYRTEKGVYVQFSDDPKEEAIQRGRFTEICPELCELRYFTPQIDSGWNYRFGFRDSRDRRDRSSLFDHNIAQAIMLIMEERVETAKQIAQQALKMAVQRVTNDNTIRYVCAAIFCWFVCLVLGAAVFALLGFSVAPEEPRLYVVAGISGATGAVLSVATRLQAFRLQPCNQSNMNYLISAIRVGIGVIAGVTLLLLAPTILTDAMKKLVPHFWDAIGWQAAATLGLLAGFAERLIPNIMRWTGVQMEPAGGTPAQAFRSEENRQNSYKPVESAPSFARTQQATMKG